MEAVRGATVVAGRAAESVAAVLLSRRTWQIALPCGLLGVVTFMSFMRRLLERMHTSCRLQPPTPKQLAEEDPASNPLFRAVPALRGRLAWRQLGNFPTPVHHFRLGKGALARPGSPRGDMEFWVKREDLSSPQYGGNKVRTLQYNLGSLEASLSSPSGAGGGVVAIGSAGSNQVVATKAHAALTGIPAEAVDCCFLVEDKKEMDNTLNYLSALSLPGMQGPIGCGMPRVLRALGMWPFGSRDRFWVLPPGGNNPLAVLGQAGGALELAEQIARGEVPDPDGIVLAYGSSCTTTGILLGVALARSLGIPAFRRPGFRVYAQPVHPAICVMHKLSGFCKATSMPMTVGRGLNDAAAIIAANGGPDVTEAALHSMRHELIVSCDLGIAGTYGAHSAKSLSAKEAFDSHCQSLDAHEDPGLWLCGHFTAKSFALLLKVLRGQPVGEEAGSLGPNQLTVGDSRQLIFWQTKSAVQPLGPLDEWAAFEAQGKASRKLLKWGVLGGPTGHPSAGAQQAEGPAKGPSQYRALMRPVDLNGRGP